MTDKFDHIHNGEDGLSVRNKLNSHADRLNELDGVEVRLDEHEKDTNNPHEVKAPQVALEPVLTPLGESDQNVQAALEFLYGYFTENGGAGWHIDHIDGIYTVIQINRGPTTQFPPDPKDLKVGELKLDWNEGKLWTKLGDDSDVIIGGKDVIFEAPLDGELYGRKVSDTDPTVGDWFRISLATVSDDMPDNPAEGDLWVDTENTMELYVYVDGQGWISMTGSGSGGGMADNITTDEVDGTMYNVLLGREVLDDESARWRPIYSSDVIPADGANPMTRADGSTLRNQADINKFLYNSLGEIDGNYVPVTGGEFTGPIFGPSVNDIVRDREVTLEVSGLGTNPHDDPTCPPDKVIVQTRFAAGSLGGGVDNRMKIHMPKGNADDYCGKKDIEYAIVQNKGVQQIWTCNDSGFSSDNGKTLNVVCEDVYGLSLTEGAEVEIWRTEAYATPYVTLDMLYKIMTNIDAGASVTIDTQAPADPTDGDLWFDNTENIMQLFLWHEASDAWLPVAPPATLESRVRQGEITQEAIIAQIQESLAEQERINRNVNNLGFDVEKKVDLQGTNVLYPDQAWRLRQDKLGGGTNTFVSIHNGEMGLYHVAYPSNPSHAANQQYVDDKFDAIEIPEVDISNCLTKEGQQDLVAGRWAVAQSTSSGYGQYYIEIKNDEMMLLHVKEPLDTHHATNKSYVDQAITDAISGLPPYTQTKPLLWRYNSAGGRAEDLSPGEFFIKEESNGVLKIYINQQNENSYYWHPAQSSGSNGQTQYDHTFNGESNGYGIPLTITNNKGRCMHFAMPVKGFFNVGGGSYCRIECKHHRKGGSNGTLSDGQRYIINLPGMMAPVWRW